MSGIEVVIETLKASRSANLAALRSIDAVLTILNQEAKLSQEENKDTEKTCDHAKALRVNTNGGSYLVCDCGFQESI